MKLGKFKKSCFKLLLMIIKYGIAVVLGALNGESIENFIM